jgi:hypothetical protein
MKVIFDGKPPSSYPCRLASVVITDNPDDPYQLVVQAATERTFRDSTLLREMEILGMLLCNFTRRN